MKQGGEVERRPPQPEPHNRVPEHDPAQESEPSAQARSNTEAVDPLLEYQRLFGNAAVVRSLHALPLTVLLANRAMQTGLGNAAIARMLLAQSGEWDEEKKPSLADNGDEASTTDARFETKTTAETNPTEDNIRADLAAQQTAETEPQSVTTSERPASAQPPEKIDTDANEASATRTGESEDGEAGTESEALLPGEGVLTEDATESTAQVAETQSETPIEMVVSSPEQAEEGEADLQAWHAEVSGAVNIIPQADLGDAANGAASLSEQGQKQRQARQPVRRRIPQQARDATSRPPEVEDAPPPPPPMADLVPAATQLVVAKSERHLTNVTLPNLQRSQRGTLPVAGLRPVRAPLPAPAVGYTRQPGGTSNRSEASNDTNRDQQQVEQLRNQTQQLAPDELRRAPGQGVTLEDKPPEPRPPLPRSARSAMAQVLAQLLAEPQASAERILSEARKAAYAGEKLQQIYPDIGSDELSGLTESVTAELRRVADEAGIAKGELNDKIEQRNQQLAEQRTRVNNEINTSSTQQQAERQTEAEEENSEVAGAKRGVDEVSVRQLEAANGEGDPTVVRFKRDQQIERLNQTVGQQRAAYQQAADRRKGQLDLAMRAQIQAYQTVVQKDQRAIRADHVAEQPLPNAVHLELTAVHDWAAAHERELRRKIYQLKRDAQTQVDGFRTDISEAGDKAGEMVRDRADEKLGIQRSWWQKLFARFKSWFSQAQAETAVWETARAGETRDAVLTDFAVLNQFRIRAGENVDVNSAEALRGLSEEQKAVVRAYYSNGPDARNPISAVAAGLKVRLSLQRRPQLIQRFETALAKKASSEWRNLDLLGKAQQSGFSAAHISKELYQAMHGGVTGWGTDEARIYRALSSLTQVQGLAVRKAYHARHGLDLDDDLKSELSGAELTRAEAQLSGDAILADVAALYEAMSGWGTDEDTIMRTLRGKSEEERQRIIEEYRRQYNVDLTTRLDEELSSHELDRANALMEGDVARADAIAIDEAMRGSWTGLGTDEAAIEAVYAQVRRDVSAEAARKGWTTAQMEAEILRRNRSVENSYNATYGADWKQGDESALRQAYRSELSGPELDLANALSDNDIVRADAARIAVEAQSTFVTDDDVVNGVLRKQYERALEELRRDEWPAIQRRLNAQARQEGWDPYRLRQEQRRAERAMEQRAQTRSRGYMRELESSYNADYSRWGRNGLRSVVQNNLSGHDQDKARDLLAQGGYLSPAQEIHYAVEGVGTDEDAIRRALVGRSPEEIEAIRREWNRLHPNELLDDRLESELSGRDEFDTGMLLQGEPQNAEQEIAQMRQRARWEFDNSSGFLAGDQERLLREDVEHMENTYRVLNDPNASARERQLAMARFKQSTGTVSTAIEGYREQMDAATDALATAAGVVAAIVVVVVAALLTPFTGGGSAAAGAGILTALGGALTSGAVAAGAAVAAAAATIITKQAMLGDAYSGEDMALDLVVGAVDALAAYATAGIGAGLLKAARGGTLARMAASPSRLSRVAAHGLAEGAEGILGSIPAAITGNVARDENWKQGNPLTNILTGVVVEVGIGTVVSAGLGGVSGLRQVSPTPDVRPQGDLLAHRGTPRERITQWRAYQAEHPDANMRDFLRDFDDGVAQRLGAGDAVRRQQRRLRTELLSGIPPSERRQFADASIEVISDADFTRITRSQRGQAVVMIEGGKPRILLREGADPRVLREEGIHLLQSVDPRTRSAVRSLDERRMAKWDELDVTDQLSLYRTKLDLEIDAHGRLLRDLNNELSSSGLSTTSRRNLRVQIDEATNTLRNLQRRLDEIDNLGTSRRMELRAGDPPLDQPARLFAKRDPTWAPEGYPPTPPGHKYVEQSNGEFQLQLQRGSGVEPKTVILDSVSGKRVVVPRAPDAEASYIATTHYGYPAPPEGHGYVKLKGESDYQLYHKTRGTNAEFKVVKDKFNGEQVVVPRSASGSNHLATTRYEYPDPPAGHHYRQKDSGEFYLYRDDPSVAHNKVVFDEAGKPSIGKASDKRLTWDELRLSLEGKRRARAVTAFADFDTAVRHMDLVDQQVLSGHKGVIQILWDHLGTGGRTELFNDLFNNGALQRLGSLDGGVIRTLTSHQYRQFLRRMRSQVGEFLAGLPPGTLFADNKRPLDAFLDAAADSATKGHIFGEYRRAMFRRMRGVALRDRDRLSLHVDRGSGKTVSRNADGAMEVGRLRGESAPPPGKYFVEDKAGKGAFKLDQAEDYARAYQGPPGQKRMHLTPDSGPSDYKGIVYVFDGLDNAKAARTALGGGNYGTKQALKHKDGGIFISYYDTDGRLQWLAP